MELYKLSNKELKELCILQERVADSVLPDLMKMVRVPFTANKDSAKTDEITGDVQPVIIPQIELFSFYLSPIEEMENELKNRGVLEEHRQNMPFIDYENAQFLIYDSFYDRLSHLFYLHEKGFLTEENMKHVSNVLQASVNHFSMMS